MTEQTYRDTLVSIFTADPSLCTGVLVDKTGSVDLGSLGFWRQRGNVPGIVHRESPAIRGQQLVVTFGLATQQKPDRMYGTLAMLAFAASCDAQHYAVNPRAQATPDQMADYTLRHKDRLKRYISRCVRHYQNREQKTAA